MVQLNFGSNRQSFNTIQYMTVLFLSGLCFYATHITMNVQYAHPQSQSEERDDVVIQTMNSRTELLSQNMSRKLLFFTHARGGSSIGRMMFDMDPNVMFWCEALAAYFLAYYGLHYTSLPQRALYTADIKRINFTEIEQRQLADFISNMFNCNFEDLPSHALLHPTLTCSHSHRDTWRCFGHDTANSVCGKRYPPSGTCGYLTENSKVMFCPELLDVTRAHLKQVDPTTISVKSLVTILEDKRNLLTGTQQKKTINLTNLVAHEICIEKIKRHQEVCFENSMRQCKSSSFHVIETNRIKMDEVEAIIQRIPDVFIIHYVRDPRGIALSRLKQRWTVDHGRSGVIDETRYLCSRMREDLRVRHALERRYPGVILQLRYEDLVENPVNVAREAYAHVGKELPETSEWPSFSAEALHASVEIDGGSMNLMKMNGTKSIDKWRTELPDDQKEALGHIGCEDVLQELGYLLE